MAQLFKGIGLQTGEIGIHGMRFDERKESIIGQGSSASMALEFRYISTFAAPEETGMGQMIDFGRPDGSACRGYPAGAGQDCPGVVVIQEWWGLNDQIRGVADHAFFNERRGDVYSAACAIQAWERTLGFLARHVG